MALIVSLSSRDSSTPVACVIERVEIGTTAAQIHTDAFISAAREARANGFRAVVLVVEDFAAVLRLQRYDAARDTTRKPEIAANLTRDMVDTALAAGTVVG